MMDRMHPPGVCKSMTRVLGALLLALAFAACGGGSKKAAAKPTPLPNGYVVQFGVFSNPQNAQQLIERLKQAGIEAQTETRVQLPAFKTKAEADAALAKMKAKGISATLLAR